MLTVDVQKPVARVTLDRPGIHNALNDELIPLVTQAFTELGVTVSPEVCEFYSRFEGPFSTRHTGFELLDACVGTGECAITGATTICRRQFNLPDRFLVISNYLGGGVLMLDTLTDQVFNVDFEGGLEELIAGRLPAEGSFASFVASYFLGSSRATLP